MKKFATFLTVFALCVGAQAQIWNSVVGANHEIQGNDTFRVFFLDGTHAAQLIQKLATMHGAPQGDGSGNMTWVNVPVPGVGTGMNINLNDGAMIFDPNANTWFHSTFLNAVDMENKLSHDPARFRRMFITIKKNNTNRVKTAQAEAAVIQYVENLLFN